MEQKKVIRKQMKQQLIEQSESVRKVKSDAIFNRVIALDEWVVSSCIGITISRSFEVSTRRLIEQAWHEGKRIVVPKCKHESREMDFYEICDFAQLEIVYAGLYEPKVKETQLILAGDIDLLILPGIAFTPNGDRLGFGGGYYDRFLTNYQGKLMALAFDFQMLDFVPVEEHDVTVDLIVTDVCVKE